MADYLWLIYLVQNIFTVEIPPSNFQYLYIDCTSEEQNKAENVNFKAE